jgi:hypothetical protein
LRKQGFIHAVFGLYKKGGMLMTPIPTAFLPDSCTLVTVFLSGAVTQTALSNVRIDITKTADKYRNASGTLWFDCANSNPAGAVFALTGECISGEAVRRQYIIYGDTEAEITGITKHMGASLPHHYEIKLGGVIPYNG